MSNLKWRFPLANFGPKYGFNHAGIETFTGRRIESLTREIIQNSLDAKDFTKKGEPVIIEFSKFNLEKNKFPDLKTLSAAIDSSYIEARKLTDTTPQSFFRNAKKIIAADEIPFLRVSDFNTIGLKGVNSRSSSPWTNLVKAQGVSDKASTDGGSFGIGKNAAYACSDLRTIIYSTLTVDGEVGTQGVASLISYSVEDSRDHTQGIGYLSVSDENDAIEKLISYDSNFERKEPGTDIFIAGVTEEENIVDEIIIASLDNFFYAIYKNDLEIRVKNKTLNHLTLKSLLNEYREEINLTTYELSRLFYDENVNIYEENIYGTEKDIEIRIIIDEDGSRRVSMIRKPWMKIKEASGFPGQYKFFGTVIIKGNDLNTLLRKTENPQHDNWEPDRINHDPKTKKLAIDLIYKITKTIRDKLEKLHEVPLGDYADIFGAEDYIPLTDVSGNYQAQQKVEEAVKSSKISPMSTLTDNKPQMTISESEYELSLDLDDYEELDYDEPDPYKEKSKHKKMTFEESLKKTTTRVNAKREDIKIISKNRHEGEYRLIITSNKAHQYHLKFNILDEQSKIIDGAIIIQNAVVNGKPVAFFDNYLQYIELQEGQNLLDIKINQDIYVSIGVEIYEIQR